jgi:hypothetical protein
MSRTNVFVSYSHRDHGWLERLRQHLGVLERKGRVHVWSDTQITVGEAWEKEIQKALGESRVAVLLVSPAFLASDYIWKKEMKLILEHKAKGMKVFPLIVRPCAWRIAEELEGLQARPTEGRALSTGSDAQADRDMADFVYELAELVEALPGNMTVQDTPLAERYQASPNQRPVPDSGRQQGAKRSEAEQ